jgi:hypothetical protein
MAGAMGKKQERKKPAARFGPWPVLLKSVVWSVFDNENIKKEYFVVIKFDKPALRFYDVQ